MTAKERYLNKYRNYTDDELRRAIDQLSAEASYHPHVRDELDSARQIARERDLFV